MRRFALLYVLLASLFCHGLALAQGASIDTATQQQKLEARKAFGEGMASFNAGDLEAALQSFRASYGAVASPNSHLMIGKTLTQLGRNVEAYKEMKVTVAEAEVAAANAPKYKRALDSARALAEELRGKVGLVTVRVAGAADLPPGSVTVAGEGVDDLTEPVVVEPGRVQVTVKTATKSDEKLVEVEAGGDVTVELSVVEDAPPPPPDEETEHEPGLKRTLAYIAGGIGVAGMLTFAIFGGMTMSTYDDLDDNCVEGACPQDKEEDIDAGKTYQTVANVGMVIGVSMLITGTALFLIDLQEGGEDSETATKLHVGPTSLGISGTF